MTQNSEEPQDSEKKKPHWLHIVVDGEDGTYVAIRGARIAEGLAAVIGCIVVLFILTVVVGVGFAEILEWTATAVR